MDIDSLPAVTIGKYRWWGTNHRELVGIKQEIFQQGIYDCRLSASLSRIIDAGAHVGLAALRFKLQYPTASIICVEPHPVSAEILRHNLWFNRLEGVKVIEAALSHRPGTVVLYADTSADAWLSTTGQAGSWDHQQTTDPFTVDTTNLDDLIDGPVDLLKMDIEGAEIDVLRACAKRNQLHNLIIELHPPHTPTNLEKIFRSTHNLEIHPHHFGLKLCYLTLKNGASARIRT